MNDHTPQQPADAPGRPGHEPSEVRIRGIFIFGAALIALIAVAMLVLAGMMRGFSAEEKADGTTTKELVQNRPGDFPAPNLQRHTTYDMVEFRKKEDAALSSYGWEDRRAGIAQIPIDRAIDILARDGLPRPKPPEKPAAPEPKPAATEPGEKE
jgi:hypothetical protein